MFQVKKLEERIAPTSGVFALNDVATDSVHGNGHVSDALNSADNLSGNSVANANSATTNGNSVGNVVFSD